MDRPVILFACALVAAQAASIPVAAAADAVHGKQVYESLCAGCHTMNRNLAGPAHRGVFGRKAALAPGFDYSPAVKSSNVVWNEQTLDKWLADPEAFIPGQKMGIAVESAKDRADVIQYLKEESRR